MTTFLYGANVRANEIRQHYLRYGGRGNPLILIPGITSPAPTWGFVAERLGETFDTYVLDVRGRGLSETGEHLIYELDACAADVLGFAAGLGLKEYVVLGHSMGARIALRAACQPGSEISRLVLVDPPVTGPGRRPYPTPLAWYTDSIQLAQRGIQGSELRAFSPTWPEEQLRLRAEWLHTCNLSAVIASYKGFHEDNIHQHLPHIQIPCLLVVAGKGGVIFPEDVEEIQKLSPGILVARVENAGHMIPWDNYDGFFQAIGSFLS
jgi:N-formylmaleamate deformylase